MVAASMGSTRRRCPSGLGVWGQKSGLAGPQAHVCGRIAVIVVLLKEAGLQVHWGKAHRQQAVADSGERRGW